MPPSPLPRRAGAPARTSLPRFLLLLGAWVLLAGILFPGPAQADDLVTALERLDKNAKDPFEQRERERGIRDLGKIGGPKAAAALVPLYADPFEHLADRATSALIQMLKGERAAETRTWLQAKGLRQRSAPFRAAIWTAFGVNRDVEALQGWSPKEKDPQVHLAYVRALSRLAEDVQVSGPLPTILARSKDPRVQLEAAAGIGRHETADTATDLLRPDLGHKLGARRAGALLGLHAAGTITSAEIDAARTDIDARVRMALAELLSQDHESTAWPARGTPLLDGLLDDADWHVRAAAIQAALRIWQPDVIPLLIPRLGAETGRLQDDVHRALQTLTGQDIAVDVDLWRAWWAAQEATFDPGPRPRLDRAGRVPFGAGRAAGEEERTAAFFDLPLHSKRLLFLFDVSGSMRNETRDGSGVTKLALLQQEIEATLGRLREDVTFDLAIYRYPSDFPPAPKLTRAFGKPRAATRRHVKKALAWLGKQDAKGWGAFMEPLETFLASEDADTIILLSDGRPSRGWLDRDIRILQELPHANRFRYVAIHTVLVGQKGADRRFMEDLAQLTGGRFRAVTR